MSYCAVCSELIGSAEDVHGTDPLCAKCEKLLQWFLNHYADVAFREPTWLNANTTFHELGVESLDYVDWLLEAQNQFDVIIPNHEAQKMRSVGDYLRHIRGKQRL